MGRVALPTLPHSKPSLYHYVQTLNGYPYNLNHTIPGSLHSTRSPNTLRSPLATFPTTSPKFEYQNTRPLLHI